MTVKRRTTMKIVQINLNHCEAAQDILVKTVIDEKADAVLISEPYKIPDNSRWICDKTRSAAIWTTGRHAFQECSSDTEGFVRAKINGVHFYSCYARPSWEIDQFQTMLDKLVADISSRNPVVVGGDFNAWATEWGSSRTNVRGRLLLETFASMGSIGIANNGGALTYRKAGGGSIIDITLMSHALLRSAKWWVSEEFTYSDHQAVMFTLTTGRTTIAAPKWTGPKWRDSVFDKDTFDEVVDSATLVQQTADELAEELTETIATACDAAMPRRTTSKGRVPCYWWNDKIRVLRSKCLRARRVMQRSRGIANFHEVLLAFKSARRELQKAIKASKVRCFKQLCDEADINPWGTAYKVVMSRLKPGAAPQITCPVLLGKIVKQLFPRRHNTEFQVYGERNESISPQITTEELHNACRNIAPRRAPGPDGIPNVAVKAAAQRRPDLFIRTFQACIDEGVFPKQWKTQHLVLLPKGKMPPGVPTSYRPICLVNTTGKILERILYDRLLKEAEEKEALSNLQFGFRKGRSTVQAIGTIVNIANAAIEGRRWREGSKEYCAVVTLDIKNAFNTASWSAIKKSVARINAPTYLRKILASYLSQRKLKYNSDEGTKYYDVTAGVPQGSVLGPLLWNIMYDGILRLELPEKTTIVGFADDIAIVVTAKHIHEIEAAINAAVAKIKNWLVANELQLADHKTEAVLISSRKKVEFVSFQVGEQTIVSKQAIKYLGVMIDNRLKFAEHIHYTSEKASRVQAALSRIMPNIGGPKFVRRLVLSKVISSILLYAAPVWAHVMMTQATRRKFTRVQRLSALRVISGFRTISEEAALVIAGMLPIDIMADEMTRIYGRRTRDRQALKAIKEEERATSMAKWQERWDTSTKGRWTYKLIPSITTWVRRKYGDCNYQLTQFLSGHGGYRKYLHKFGHDDSPMCTLCDEVEDTEHAVFYCRRFRDWRTIQQPPSEIVQKMLNSENEWEETLTFIATVQNELRKLEAERRASTAAVGEA